MEAAEGRPIDESVQEPAERSADTPDSDEMNRFVLDLFDEFNRDPGHAITDVELNRYNEDPDHSELSNMERFVSMIKFSEKVPQMYREMSIDELRHLIEKGLQSRKFVPIVPNALAGTYHHHFCGPFRTHMKSLINDCQNRYFSGKGCSIDHSICCKTQGDKRPIQELERVHVTDRITRSPRSLQSVGLGNRLKESQRCNPSIQRKSPCNFASR